MNRLFLIILVFFLGLTYQLHAKSFTNLSEPKDNFSSVDQNVKLEFPKDHGFHPSFRTEWWYVTANLKNQDNEPLGIQWTLFRSSLENTGILNGWKTSQIWMGHAAVTTKNYHFFSEKFARGGVGQAGAQASPFKAWIDDWNFSGDWDNAQLNAAGDQFSYNLKISSQKPLVLHGPNGVSKKSPTGAKSFYYSQPFFKVDGSVEINGITHEVEGNAWADREWSSELLAEDQIGWNWLGLHFDDGSKLMVFEVKSKSGRSFFSGTRVYKNGEYELLQPQNFILQPKILSQTKGDKIHLDWEIEIPNENLNVTIKPINRNSYMETFIPYWEGPVSFTGTHSGVGFLEVTLTK